MCRQRYLDPLLKAADGGLLGSIEFGVVVYQTRSLFRCVSPQLRHSRCVSVMSGVCSAMEISQCSSKVSTMRYNFPRNSRCDACQLIGQLRWKQYILGCV